MRRVLQSVSQSERIRDTAVSAPVTRDIVKRYVAGARVPDAVPPVYVSSPILPDSDGDGLSDLEEVYRFGTDPMVADTDEDTLKKKALTDERVKKFIEDRPVKKVIVVKKKLVNIVI